MIHDFLQERAALYVSGAMPSEERGEFELVLEFHHELRTHVGEMLEVARQIIVATAARPAAPLSLAVKANILSAISTRPQQVKPEGLVRSGPDGLVQWINPAFSAMCGYTIEELWAKNSALSCKASVPIVPPSSACAKPCTNTVRAGRRF